MNALKSKFDYGSLGQQYTPPLCFEFSGKILQFAFDGFNASAQFTDDKNLIWTRDGDREETKYWCLKADDYMYMLSFALTGNRCTTLIIDTLAGLLTMDEVSFDEAEKPIQTIAFGAVRKDGQELPSKRHAYTQDLSGNAFRWTYCDTYWHVETYFETEHTLVTNYPDIKGTFSYRAVKITDTMYYTCNGDDRESICELMNLRHLTCVARSVVSDSGGKAIPLGAIGRFEEPDEG